MANAPAPPPQPSFPWAQSGLMPIAAFADWVFSIDATVRALVTGMFGAPAQLTDALNDAAAAAAGVKVGQLYRSGSIVMVRVI